MEMKELLQKILTDKTVRNASALNLLAPSMAAVGAPWNDR